MEFNPAPPFILLLDINSCFATIEQQANPNLRGKEIAVCSYDTPGGIILAASIEAKKLGIKTGMRISDAKKLFSDLIILLPDPPKYRDVHEKLFKLLLSYSDKVEPKSIDEFIVDLKGYPCLDKKNIVEVAGEIKKRIKKEIGEWITVSVGIAPNRYLAKVAAGIIKPDGLVVIDRNNFLDVYSKLKLTDLTGIKEGNGRRLNLVGIGTVVEFYLSPLSKLKSAFKSAFGYTWYLRLHGYETDAIITKRKSFGNEVALGRNISTTSELSPILSRLVDKMSTRVRTAGYRAKGIRLSLLFKDGTYYQKSKSVEKYLYTSQEFLKEALNLLLRANPKKPVRVISFSCFSLVRNGFIQEELFRDVVKSNNLIKEVDNINEKWGDFTIGTAKAIKAKDVVLDRIAFGSTRK